MGSHVVVDVAARSHPGRMRQTNEDAFAVTPLAGELRIEAPAIRGRRVLGDGILLAVFDGMGGYSGEQAAQQAAGEVVASLCAAPLPGGEDELQARLERALGAANDALLEASRTIPARHGTGSTATTVAVIEGAAALAHVGDTRAYVLRGRRMAQLTRDDRLFEEMRARGQEPTAEHEAHRRVITRALGIQEALEPRGARLSIRRGDVLLLCSDGLTDMLADDAVRAILLRHRDPGVAARVLVDEACRAGGHDNVTAIVARFEGDGLLLPAKGEPLAR
jgi:protein phosphatase